ncbi:MAG TPA: hypothetical protein VG148_17725 [Pyrinomonadaceae bacterium]|nr:hypothetical protein [Pyrinomonadaceae bacterium]
MRKTFLAFALLCSLAAAAAAQEKAQAGRVTIDPDQNYLVLSTKRIQTMEKELDEVSAKGFRVLYGGPTEALDMALFLQRVRQPGEPTYAYKVLATSRLKTMEKELNEAARGGFRMLPRTAIFKRGLLTVELVMLMERAPQADKNYEYKLVSAGKESKLHKKIEEAVAQGFAPLTIVTGGEHIVVMERETAAAAAPAPQPAAQE